MDFILKFFPGITSIGPWLSKKGIFYATILGFVFAVTLINIGFIPIPPHNPEATTYPLWHISYLIGFPILFICLWFLITQGYLRSGQGTKIGLAYDGHAVNLLDWKRTKRKLCDLLKNGEIKNKVTLRFVPLSYCTEGEDANKFMKRYSFSILTTVQQSPSIKNSPDNAQHPIPMNVNLRIVTKAEEKQFLKTTFKNALGIINLKRKSVSTLADLLDTQARNLYDIMLFFVASHCYLQEKYEDSSVILQYLDESISSIIKQTQEPRQQIRYLCANCFFKPAEFSFAEVPPLDELQKICDFAEKAMPYFDEFPGVAMTLSRIRFLVGNIQGATEIMERYRDKIEELRKSGQKPTNRVLMVYSLNTGFLSFIQGHWLNASNSYHNMLSIDEYRNENWEGIIEFIDYVATLECYEGICYLQTFYRLIAKKSVPDGLCTAAQEWANQDGSRKELHTFLSRKYPSLAESPKRKALTTKRPSGNTKQRSKRKNKRKKH